MSQRAFSFAINEDVLVKDFLGVVTLREAFHLPLSMQVHDEVRSLQQRTAQVGPEDSMHDVWHYVWGSREFESRYYYTFYFKDVQAHQAYRWILKSKS